MQNVIKQLSRAILTLGLLLLPFVVSAQREVIDLSTRGPQVGETIPGFNLPDQNGEVWSEKSILGPNGAMLVFIRSANW